MSQQSKPEKWNVLGGPLLACCFAPTTGFFRDGYCRTDQADRGRHVVCAQMTSEFLAYTRKRGNDLSTPRPEFGFPGLAPGDRWCLCALRWKEAHQAGVAPPVILEACEHTALDISSLETLRQYAVKAVH
jgi:uncharacterized protein (DUF2237 family)